MRDFLRPTVRALTYVGGEIGSAVAALNDDRRLVTTAEPSEYRTDTHGLLIFRRL
jgi:hypothetical protein